MPTDSGTAADIPLTPGIPLATPALNQYWLVNTAILDAPNGHEILHAEGPTRVELLAEGRVRSLPGARNAIDGFLPDSVLTDPDSPSGLMRFAQREGELSFVKEGTVWAARVYPGAFLRVLPSDGETVRVRLPQWWAFVGKARDWGPEPLPLVGPDGSRYVWATRNALNNVRFGLNPGDRDVWMAKVPGSEPARFRASQYREGVEVFLREVDAATVYQLSPVDWFGPQNRWPAYVTQTEEGRLLLSPPGGPVTVPTPISTPPERMALVNPAALDLLSSVVTENRSIWWLSTSGGPEIQCIQWSFRDTRVAPSSGGGRKLLSRLLRAQPLSLADGTTKPFYETSYVRHPREALGALFFQAIRPHACHVAARYIPVASAQEELVVGIVVPAGSEKDIDHVIAYEPRELERWLLSASRCEEVRREVTAAIERNGTLTTRVGLHHDHWLWTSDGGLQADCGL